jgi:hypothetical protein
MDLATTASVMCASLNGAFLLTGQDNTFREVTGLNPDSFVERAFEFHLSAAQALAAHHIGNGHATSHGANGVTSKGRARNRQEREKGFQQDSAATAHA